MTVTNSMLCNENTATFCAGGNDPCSSIGPEWVLSSSLSSSRCPSGQREVTCNRSQFLGTPQVCCVNNYSAANPPINNLCFSDSPADMMTCNQDVRSITGPGCEGLFAQSCVDGLTTDQAFQSAWSASSQYCPQIITAHANGTSADLTWAQGAMQSVFTQYFGTVNGGQINTSSSSINTFQENLYQLCSSHPEVCAPALTNLCAQYSLSAAENNLNIAQFCGCYLQSANYDSYTNSFGIPFQCSPICARQTSIQPAAPPTGLGPCTESICIIDDTTFNFINSSGGNVSFSQICGGCGNDSGTGSGTGQCQCVISGVTLNVAQSSVGNINLSQNCGGAVNCTVPNPNDPNGPAIQVPCSGVPSANPLAGISPGTLIAVILIGLVVLVIIIIIIVVIVQSRRRSALVATMTSGSMADTGLTSGSMADTGLTSSSMADTGLTSSSMTGTNIT